MLHNNAVYVINYNGLTYYKNDDGQGVPKMAIFILHNNHVNVCKVHTFWEGHVVKKWEKKSISLNL